MTKRHTFRAFTGLFTLLLSAGPSVAAQDFTLDPAASQLQVFTDKAGLFSRMAHTHDIRARTFSGAVHVDEQNISKSRLSLSVVPSSLQVIDAEMSTKDRAQVQKNMEKSVLEVAQFPSIQFTARSVTGQKTGNHSYDVQILGTLNLHGLEKQITVNAKVTVEGAVLTASGDVPLRQTDFGITPFSAGLGAVKVKDEVRIHFEMTARSAGAKPAQSSDESQE